MDLLDFHSHAFGPNTIHNLIVGREERVPNQLFSAGLHPWYLEKGKVEERLQTLEHLAHHEQCVALGEAGLDKLCPTPWDLQIQAFEAQIQLANKLQKPLIIHCVKAHQEVIQLKERAQVAWILHGFNQKSTIGEKILQAGFYVSLGKALLKSESNASRFIPYVPLDRLFLETDDAEIPIKDIYKAASERLHLPIEKLATNLQVNLMRLRLKGKS